MRKGSPPPRGRRLFVRRPYNLEQIEPALISPPFSMRFLRMSKAPAPARRYSLRSFPIDKGMIAPGIVLAGLLFAAYKSTSSEQENDDE